MPSTLIYYNSKENLKKKKLGGDQKTKLKLIKKVKKKKNYLPKK